MEATEMNKNIGFYLKRINDIFTNGANQMLRETGITRSQTEILMFLNRNRIMEKNVTQKDIEEFFGLSHSTVIGILSRLKGKGFVEICVNESDRRFRDVSMTEKALELSDKMRNNMKKTEEFYSSVLTDEQAAELKKLLCIVYEGLKNNIGDSGCERKASDKK